MIVALAGHVDHGKTALVRALTGIDPDRLPDEKARGMTIDLGFAHTVLPGGETVGFVDVPGHERFLTNMLAGVLSIDSVLLVVAADDGPMPQTHEHLSILALTGITDIAVAVTKIDRVEEARVAAVTVEVREVLARSGYTDPTVMPVSAIAGTGMEALRSWIGAKAAVWRRRSSAGGFRLAVDRGFLVPGTGLVVTGTVASGTVAVGDRLLLSPAHLAARVRGIQVHHAAADTASAGDRCALAIAGTRIEKTTVRRGDWLVAPSLHAPTARLDAQIRVVEGRVLKHASPVHVHIGSAAIGARALTGTDGFVHLTLQRETAALSGDRIVLRDDATGRVVAGGRVIDPFPPARRVPREQRAASLAAMASADAQTALDGLLRTEGWVDLARFRLARNLETPTDLTGGIRIGRSARPILVSADTNESLGEALLRTLDGWHAKHPGLPGPGKATLLSALRAWPEEIAEAVLLDRLSRGDIVRRDAVFHLPGHKAILAAADAAAWKRIEPALAAEPLRPPRVREVAELLAIQPEDAESLLVRLERFGLLLRVAPNRFYLPSGVIALGDIAAALAAESDEGTFIVAAFNQRSGIGRNVTIQVLEYLDKIGVTRRAGEPRHVVRAAADVLG
jgi:selenocysteine-specific elongation factor